MSLVKVVGKFGRNFSTSLIRRSDYGHDEGGVAWVNLPFKYKGRGRMTLYFCVFFGTGIWAPFLVLRTALYKTNGK